MEPSEKGITQEALPKNLFIEINEPELISIQMSQGFKDWLEKDSFTPQMYFEDRIPYLKEKLKRATGLSFSIRATESSLEIRTIYGGYKFDDNAIGTINELLDMANQE